MPCRRGWGGGETRQAHGPGLGKRQGWGPLPSADPKPRPRLPPLSSWGAAGLSGAEASQAAPGACPLVFAGWPQAQLSPVPRAGRPWVGGLEGRAGLVWGPQAQGAWPGPTCAPPPAAGQGPSGRDDASSGGPPLAVSAGQQAGPRGRPAPQSEPGTVCWGAGPGAGTATVILVQEQEASGRGLVLGAGAGFAGMRGLVCGDRRRCVLLPPQVTPRACVSPLQSEGETGLPWGATGS